MVNEPKRISGNTTAPGAVGGTGISRMGPGTGTDVRRLVNFHNIWWGFSVEPESAGANAAGTWVLWQNQDASATDPLWNFTTLGDGSQNMRIIACGVWAASNESPFNFSSHLNSSRNLVVNNELVLTVTLTGLTAGAARINTLLCAGLSVK